MLHLVAPSALGMGLAIGLALAAPASPQEGATPDLRQWIAPTTRNVAFAPQAAASPVVVTAFDAHVRIQGRVARTTLQIALRNPGVRPAEAELLLPVPDGAAVSGFTFEGTGPAPSARLLPATEARGTYDDIVRRLRDPALLEFAGRAAVRSSVFPVPAGGTQAVRLTYEETLPRDGTRVDYELLRSTALDGAAPFTLTLEVVGEPAPAAVYSPTHDLRPANPGGHLFRVSEAAGQASGTFRCAILEAHEGLQASVIACPDAEGPGGTFLLFAGLGGEEKSDPLPREVTIVLDRSGSMGGEKFDQARRAALQVLEGLRPGESFRIVDYSEQAASMGPARTKSSETMAAARTYLANLTAGGGTNIAAALEMALQAPPAEGFLPVVLFLTDGRATVGPTREQDLNAVVAASNEHERRLFTFGVGLDVNAPLLDAIALGSRATSAYVTPGEDIELAVAGVFRRLQGPLATNLDLHVFDPETGADDATAVRDRLPREVPDLFAGEQLVITGRYTAAKPIGFALTGRTAEGPRTARFTADLTRADSRNDFVARIWATRRIAELSDAIRQATGDGADPGTLLTDPRTKELAEESMRLSVRFGVLSEFTSFLALEGTSLADWNTLTAQTRTNLVVQNTANRWGQQAVDIARNTVGQANAVVPGNHNFLWQDDQLLPTANVQPTQRGMLVQRGNERIEGQLLEGLEGALPTPDETVVVGSEAYLRLVDELVEDRRNDVAAYGGNVVYAHRGRVIRQVQLPAPAPAQGPVQN